MSKYSLLPVVAALLALALPTPAHAGKGNKGAAKAGHGDKAARPRKVIKMYDTNSNGVIDGAEVDAIRKAYEADKTGPIKQFDTNADGKLDDQEIAAIKAPVKGAGKAGKGAGKKGKNAPVPATT